MSLINHIRMFLEKFTTAGQQNSTQKRTSSRAGNVVLNLQRYLFSHHAAHADA